MYLFSQLQEAVLRPEAIDYAFESFQKHVQSYFSGLDSKIGRMRKRVQELKREIESGVEKLLACNNNPTLVDAINRRQQELDDITRQLLSTDADSISADLGHIRQFVTEQVADISRLLKVDAEKAKAELRKHVTEIRMVPVTEGRTGHYIAEGKWNLLGGYGEVVSGDLLRTHSDGCGGRI